MVIKHSWHRYLNNCLKWHQCTETGWEFNLYNVSALICLKKEKVSIAAHGAQHMHRYRSVKGINQLIISVNQYMSVALKLTWDTFTYLYWHLSCFILFMIFCILILITIIILTTNHYYYRYCKNSWYHLDSFRLICTLFLISSQLWFLMIMCIIFL